MSDSKQSTIAVCLDFSKVFYTVNHDTWMSKLQYNGNQGCHAELVSILSSNMKQYVSIKNYSSSMSNISLCSASKERFLLYINGMHRSSNQMRFVYFADDATFYASDSDIT